MESYLRNWRQDALNKHQYDAAIFVGDKLLALTESDEDAYALAHTHFAAANYTRALAYVKRGELIERSPAARYLASYCYIKLDRHEEALHLLGEKNPTHLTASAEPQRRKLQHLSNGLSDKQQGKSRAPYRTDRVDRSEERERESADNLKFEAGMCYLRGLCFAKHNAFDRAKECYKDAVRIDIQCFEAFEQLVKNALMSPGEEWDFLNGLDFESITHNSGTTENVPEAADFVRNLYSTRLSKYTHPENFNMAIETLSTHYKLGQNADILLARAEILFTCSRFQDALDLTSQILKTDPYNFACMPLHLALLHQLDHHHALFALAHDLADTHPEVPCTWLAVGTYYYAKDRIPEARSYFSKASLMDPHFGAAWIGFAHTFAAEGESDQAIAAYSTAARLFQGTHLPQMFLGMQELVLGNITIAREFLTAAYNVCDRDPLLINEIGVATFHEENYESAVRHFVYALEIAKENNAPAHHYAGTRLNLSHALRRSGQFEAALQEVEEVIRLGMCEADVFTTKGLTLLELDQTFEAVTAFHEALAISPQHPMASDLLNKALKQLTDEGADILGGADEDELEDALRRRLDERRAQRNPLGGPSRSSLKPPGSSDASVSAKTGGGRANRLARQAAGLTARSGDQTRRRTP
ncbi:unnamed protein product [Zymoseptoria tritici ST99CH_3D7]|uniref:Uncharacterized protein n=2 Tax=Zymoseptoria tritici TaxID=1047171 RepID=F9XII2_ZYMTI|nr:uncharacterized protein MYCGRDRAFT_46421 [Zymoseptoria tritici IPO323]EGP85285.1 hypothetical protein MYCGRDRAFT_46421 [Zymoseptoria tritici IPO323]SMQ53519.1 unnamed protein product [Zymoseptoria tritici ST99CH_3D7]